MRVSTPIPSMSTTLVLAALASLLSSAWGAYAHHIPNPDGTLYLRAAELFSSGHWKEALSVYKWPFYSLLIASITITTGLSTFLSAQIANAALDCATVLIFIRLVFLLGTEQSGAQLAIWAATIVLLHPRLSMLRPTIIRDHGFYTFLLLTILVLVKDLRHPLIRLKVIAFFTIALSAAFRLEALFLYLLVPGYYAFERASSRAARAGVVVTVLLLSALLIPGYIAWASGSIDFGSQASSISFSRILTTVDYFLKMRIGKFVSDFASIMPPSRNAGQLAYVGAVVAISVDTLLRALTFQMAFFAALAFAPRAIMPQQANRIVLWFSGWQLPPLIVFATFSLYLDWRYAMPFAIFLTIPVVFLLNELTEQAIAGAKWSLSLGALALTVLIISWLVALPRDQNLDHLKEAGQWIKNNLPPDAKILTNDARIAYFSERNLGMFEVASSLTTPFDRHDLRFAVVARSEPSNTPPLPTSIAKNPIGKVEGRNGRSVEIFQLQ